MRRNIIATIAMAIATTASAQTAQFSNFRYTGNDSRFSESIDRTHQY